MLTFFFQPPHNVYMSLYHSKAEEDTLLNALPSLCQEHRKRELMETPTAAERSVVQKLVLEFISSHKRIVYGGYALHLLIQDKSSGKEGIYTVHSITTTYQNVARMYGTVNHSCDSFTMEFSSNRR